MTTREIAVPALTYSRNGQVISLRPATLASLGGDIAVKKRVPAVDQDHGYDVHEVPEALLLGPQQLSSAQGIGEPSNRPPDNYHVPIQVNPNAGLTDFFRYLALQRNCKLIELADVPTSELPEPTQLFALNYPDLATFVRQEPRGLVKVSETIEKAVLIADLAIAYPNARIMILSSRVAELKFVCQSLQRDLPPSMSRKNLLALVWNRSPQAVVDDADFPRIICCTPTAAADLESEKVDIVVLLDAFDCLHERMAWPLIQTDARFRLFGLWAASRKSNEYKLARLRTVFGFQQIDLMDRGRVRREVHYACVRQGGPAPAGSTYILHEAGDRRSPESVDPQRAYIHNHQRNDQICRLARKLRSGIPLDRGKHRDVTRWLEGRSPQNWCITIVVDRLEHAIQLGNHLPDWPIVADPQIPLNDLPQSVRSRINSNIPQWVPCRIVAPYPGCRVSGYCSDIVIWASGGVAAEIPRHWMYSINSPSRPMLIVDFLDDFTPATRKLSISRMQDLKKRDVYRVGTPAVMGRIQQLEQIVRGGR